MLLPPLTDLFIYLFFLVYSGPGDKTGYRGSHGKGREGKVKGGCSWKRWQGDGEWGEGEREGGWGGEETEGARRAEKQSRVVEA